jgi:hypothetical protein
MMKQFIPISTVFAVTGISMNFAKSDDTNATMAVRIDKIEAKSISTARRLALSAYPANDSNKSLRYLYEKEGMKVFAIKNTPKIYGNKSQVIQKLPHARVAICDIKADIRSIEDCWFGQDVRASWDKTVNHSGLVERLSDTHTLVRLKGVAGYILPARDYVLNTWKTQGGVIGLRDFSSSAIVMSDAAEDAPVHWTSVRANHNSVLVLEPRGASTRCTYITEFSYAGWIYDFIVALFADKQTDALLYMKKELESDDAIDETKMSVDQIARMRFQKQQERQRSGTNLNLVEEVSIGQSELKAAVEMLEKRLADVVKTEREQKLDMSELKKRIKKDIQAAKRRLDQID